MEQVVGTAGLSAGARKPEAAERLPAHQRPGNSPVQVQITHPELPPSLFQVRRPSAEHAPGEFVDRSVGPVERLGEARHTHDGQHRSEDLFLSQAVLRADSGKDVRTNVGLVYAILQAGWNLAGQLQPSLAFADLDVLANLPRRAFVDDRADVGARVHGVADNQASRRLDKPAEKHLVDRVEHDRPAARRTLLTAIAERRLPHGLHGLVQIGRIVDHDGILAAHLADDLLHERLPLGRSSGRFEYLQAHLFRSGKGDERDLAPREANADQRTGSGQELKCVARHPRARKDLANRLADSRRLLGWFGNRRIAGRRRRDRHAGEDRRREIPRGDHRGYAPRLVGDLIPLANEPPQRSGRNSRTALRA